jgi:receptor protein-tyrosine kinase
MSRIYEALRKLESERRPAGVPESNPTEASLLQNVFPETVGLGAVPSVEIKVSGSSRLVSLAAPESLGAEKFRALATRLENLRNRRELQSLQVTSSVAHEGKTLVSANLALTLAQNPALKVLLVEGDLHTAALGPLMGVAGLHGITHWWASRDSELTSALCKTVDLPLWFLPAGSRCEQPSNILQSARFAEALVRLFSLFEWVIVDSPPLLPFVDANLWSRLLDGTLLVVREGVASVKALKKGIEAIDNLNLLGVVLNDASETEDQDYKDRYYYVRESKE